jgi:hypothetical protein
MKQHDRMAIAWTRIDEADIQLPYGDLSEPG